MNQLKKLTTNSLLLLPLGIIATLLLLFQIQGLNAKNILIINPISSSSHSLTIGVITNELMSRGHSIHVIDWKDARAPVPVSYAKLQVQQQPQVRCTNKTSCTNGAAPTKTVTTLAMNGSNSAWFVLTNEEEAGFQYPVELLWNLGTSLSSILLQPEWTGYFSFIESHCETLFSNKLLRQTLLSTTEGNQTSTAFDAAIIDVVWNDCSVAYAKYILNIKTIIGFWGSSPSTLQTDLSTNFLTSAHVATNSPIQILGTSNTKSWVNRFNYIMSKIVSQLTMWIYYYHIGKPISKYSSPENNINNVLDLQKSLNGMLVNDHLVLGTPSLFPPNYIHVGGLQCQNKEKLPKLLHELESWLNDAPFGVIYFSFGTILDVSTAPPQLALAIFEAFFQLPQKVLIRMERIPGYVANVLSSNSNIKILTSFVPQQSILAHPNTALFINHGGFQSVIESIYHAVPMIVLPIVHDATETGLKVQSKGFGLTIDRHSDNLSSSSILSCIQSVLAEPSFKDAVLAASGIMKSELQDQPPLMRAANFIEYLMVTNGAPHLQIPNTKYNVLEYFYLDVLIYLGLLYGVTKLVVILFNLLYKIK